MNHRKPGRKVRKACKKTVTITCHDFIIVRFSHRPRFHLPSISVEHICLCITATVTWADMSFIDTNTRATLVTTWTIPADIQYILYPLHHTPLGGTRASLYFPSSGIMIGAESQTGEWLTVQAQVSETQRNINRSTRRLCEQDRLLFSPRSLGKLRW